MCVGLQMQLKFYLTYILLTFSTILAEDIYSRQSKTNKRETGVPKYESSKYVELDENFEDDIEYIDDNAKSKTERVTKITDSEPETDKLIEDKSTMMKQINSHLLNQLIANSDAKDQSKTKNKDDLQEWLNAPIPTNEETDLFDDIEEKFSFDDMGSDLRGYELYHGVPGQPKSQYKTSSIHNSDKYHGKNKKKSGPPRYPPVNKDKLYEVGLLAYMRDFHLGMIL